MARIEESIVVPASLASTWDTYFDETAWPAWVDGFAEVAERAGWPEVGGTLTWRSTPAGRGEVREQVVEHEPRSLHAVEFADPAMEGRLVTRLAVQRDGALVSQAMDYQLRSRSPIAVLAGLLFVRSQVRASIRRSLQGLASVAAEREDAGEAPSPAG